MNTYTTGTQVVYGVAADPSGNFVVVWRGEGAPELDGVFGQRYDSSGTPLGPEFHVNSLTPGADNAQVAADGSGRFVVVWESSGAQPDVFARRYDSSGAPLGPEFRVNTFTTGYQAAPSVAADAAGSFVVVWSAAGDVHGQRFASTGIPLGPEFRINSYTTDSQYNSDVAVDTLGNFVVVWSSLKGDGSGSTVFGQRFASSGAPLGPEFRVNTYTTGIQGGPFVAVDAPGNFVVAWSSDGQDGSSLGVFGQRYANTGSPIGPEFRVNTSTSDVQGARDVGMDPSGNFVVVWDHDMYGSSETFGQRYASSGAPLGAEFRVNTFTVGIQIGGRVAVDSAGRFVVVWYSYPGQDGSGFGAFGQRFSMIVPVELMHFRVE